MREAPIAPARAGPRRRVPIDPDAAHVVATEGQDLAAEARMVTKGEGARVVFDPVGGPASAKRTEATRESGVLSPRGTPGPEPAVIPSRRSGRSADH